MCVAGGTLENTCNFELRSDLETVILEISSEGSKTMKDAEPTSLQALLQEPEESGIVDATVCCHQVSRVSPTLVSDAHEGAWILFSTFLGQASPSLTLFRWGLHTFTFFGLRC